MISKQPRYNLNLILQETGLKADTIRAWERRYDLPQPARSKGGHRLYSEYDLAILKWLLDRQNEGMRISQAANYWKELTGSGIDPLANQIELRPVDTLIEIDDHQHTLESFRQKWIDYCLAFDEPHSEQILSLAFAQFPITTVFSAVILPGLNEVGRLWYEGEATVQQEHFLSEIAIKKIQTLITAAPKPVHPQRILVLCPPGEQHIIASLLVTLLLKHRGWEVIYLGGNVPLDNLSRLITDVKPDLALLTATRLVTAATLLKTIHLLADHHIQAAFGGWIFAQIQGLADRIPATYLGADAASAIELIEDLISDPESRKPGHPRSLQHQALIKDLEAIQPKLNSTLQAKLSTTQSNMEALDIFQLNSNLIQDISAALTLGDIGYLRFNLTWLSRLMSTRSIQSRQLDAYLKLFSTTVEDLLGSKAEVIIQGLASSRASLQEGG